MRLLLSAIIGLILGVSVHGAAGSDVPPTKVTSSNSTVTVVFDQPNHLYDLSVATSGGATNGIQQLNGKGTNTVINDFTAFNGAHVDTNHVGSLVVTNVPWADVMAYGADPTGVADSTPAFKAAHDALGVGGGLILIPVPGQYAVNLIITNSNIHLRSWQFTKQTTVDSTTFTNSLIPFDLTKPVITIGNDLDYNYGTTLEGLNIFGKLGTPKGDIGILIKGGTHNPIISQCSVWYFTNCFKSMAGTLEIDQPHISHCWIQVPNLAGAVGLTTDRTTGPNYVNGFIVEDSHINGGTDGYVTDVTGEVWNNVQIDYVDGHGFYWGAATNPASPHRVSGLVLDGGSSTAVAYSTPNLNDYNQWDFFNGNTDIEGVLRTQSGTNVSLRMPIYGTFGGYGALIQRPFLLDEVRFFDSSVWHGYNNEPENRIRVASGNMTITAAGELHMTSGGTSVYSDKPFQVTGSISPTGNIIMPNGVAVEFTSTNGVLMSQIVQGNQNNFVIQNTSGGVYLTPTNGDYVFVYNAAWTTPTVLRVGSAGPRLPNAIPLNFDKFSGGAISSTIQQDVNDNLSLADPDGSLVLNPKSTKAVDFYNASWSPTIQFFVDSAGGHAPTNMGVATLAVTNKITVPLITNVTSLASSSAVAQVLSGTNVSVIGGLSADTVDATNGIKSAGTSYIGFGSGAINLTGRLAVTHITNVADLASTTAIAVSLSGTNVSAIGALAAPIVTATNQLHLPYVTASKVLIANAQNDATNAVLTTGTIPVASTSGISDGPIQVGAVTNVAFNGGITADNVHATNGVTSGGFVFKQVSLTQGVSPLVDSTNQTLDFAQGMYQIWTLTNDVCLNAFSGSPSAATIKFRANGGNRNVLISTNWMPLNAQGGTANGSYYQFILTNGTQFSTMSAWATGANATNVAAVWANF